MSVAVMVSPNLSCAEPQVMAWASSFFVQVPCHTFHCVMEQMPSSLSSLTMHPGFSWPWTFRRDLPFIPEHRTWLLSYWAPQFSPSTEKWFCRETTEHFSPVPLRSSLRKHDFSVLIMKDSQPISAFPIIWKMALATHKFLMVEPGSTGTIYFLHMKKYLGIKGRVMQKSNPAAWWDANWYPDVKWLNPCLSDLLGVIQTGFLKG